MSRFNPMAIFRRTNTPMSPDRNDRRRQIQEREAQAYRILGEYQERAERRARERTLSNTQQLLNELQSMTFTDEAATLTPGQLDQMRDLMMYGTSIRRQRRGGHEGGYDLVHKA